MIALPTDKYKPASLDKMIALIAMMVEKSRDSNQRLVLSTQDYAAIAGGKVSVFIICYSKKFIKNVFRIKNCKNSHPRIK